MQKRWIFLPGAFFELIASATNGGQTICHDSEKLQLVALVVETSYLNTATGHNIPTFPLFRAYLAWLSQGSSNMHSISFKRWALRHSSVQDSLMNKPSFLFVNRSVENDHVEETEKFKNSFEQIGELRREQFSLFAYRYFY